MKESKVVARIDEDLKNAAEETLHGIGLSMTAAINMFLRALTDEQRIPFETKVRKLKFASETELSASGQVEEAMNYVIRKGREDGGVIGEPVLCFDMAQNAPYMLYADGRREYDAKALGVRRS